jgi:hypothetical protein
MEIGIKGSTNRGSRTAMGSTFGLTAIATKVTLLRDRAKGREYCVKQTETDTRVVSRKT